MKIITYLFTSKNIRNVFITFTLLFNILFSFSQVDLRTCNYDCTSNNYTLKDVYLSLSDVNGEPITNTTCTIGEVRQVYIYLNYSSNSNSNIYFARLNSDLTIAGVTTFVNVLLGTIVPGDNKKLLYGPFNWTCGDELSLSNTIIAWKTNNNNDPGANYSCGSYTNSQCDFTNAFTISKPLAVQFTYKACKTGTNTTVKFISTTNGGIGPYTYAWDFNNDGGIPDSTIANPTYTYTTSNNSAKLTVTDTQNLTNTYILPIVEPTEIMLSESHTNIGCSGGTTSLTLTVTGGTPGYSYLWNTGATTKDLSDIPPGTYTVTVTDANSCTKTQSFIINQPTSLSATTSQTNVTCFEGSDGTATVTPTGGTAPYTYIWSPSGGTNATATGLIAGNYSVIVKDANNCTITKNLTIIDGDSIVPIINPLPSPAIIDCPALPAFAEATATDNSGVVSSLTFVDSITNSCAGSYTQIRTWIAKDACGNTSVPVSQTITVQDIAKPTWTTTAAALNVTLQCSDIAGLVTAQALFPVASDLCDTDVSNIVKISGQFIAQGCANAGTYTNTWTVNDDCGNISDTFTQVITIEDTTAPTWTTVAAALNVTLQCSDIAGLATAQAAFPVAADNCGGTVTYTKTSGVFAPASCVKSGTYTNTWVAKDVCLNTSTTFTQVITIEDTTAPTWTTVAAALNVTLQCSDIAGLATAQAAFPVASDNCGETVTYTKISGTFSTGSCINSGTYINIWVAKDVCNNSSTTFTQVITIEDTTAPTWVSEINSLNQTVQCSNQETLASAQALFPAASDLCDADVSNIVKTSGQFMASEGCANAGTYTNTWTVKDDCGNTSDTFTQVITIEDTTAPTWVSEINSLNQTVQCSNQEALASAQALFPTASDLCDADVLNIVKVSGQFMASEGCGNAGTYTNTWTVKDDCGNTSDIFTQVITIEDTTSPTWVTASTTLNVTLQCSDIEGLANAQLSFPVASDLCDTDVLNIVKVSGQFMASEGCGNAGTYTNTWTVKDDCGNTSDTFTQVITIEDTTAPTWVSEMASLNMTLQCSDIEGLVAAQALFPVASDLCDVDVSNIVKTSGQFMASESCGNAGTYTNTWTVKDDCGNTSDTFIQVITIEDTTAPTWVSEMASLNVTLQCSDTAGLVAAQALFPVASDLCDADVLNIVKTSGQFMASEGCGNAGTYTNTWTVKDDCGNTSNTFTQVITIEDTTTPTWVSEINSLNQTVQCSDQEALASAQALFPVASDLCDADVLNIVKISGQFIASEGCGNAGTYTNTWTVKDDCGNTSDTFTQVITIEDTTAPTWVSEMASLNVTLQCSDMEGLATAHALFPIASDLCDTDVSNIVKTSGQFMASEGCANAGTYTNTWTVKDDCGNTSDTFTQVITIEDTTAPTWVSEMASLNVTLQCSDTAGLVAAQALFPVASDLCDADVLNIVKTSGQFMASKGCGNSGTYINTWTVKDDCGNTSETFTQVITIEDTTAPTWISEMASLNMTLQCSDMEGLATAQALFPIASDLCDADVSNIVKTSGQFMAFESCANAGTYTNTWTVKDDCGNTSDTFTQVITIEDTTAPTWVSEMASLNMTLQCSDTAGLVAAQALFPVASDLCDADVLNIVKVSGQFMASEGCANAGTYTNTWAVKDDCGNTSDTFTQVIMIEDTTAPTWVSEMASLNVTLQCSDTEGLVAAQALFPVASDLCDADVLNIVKTSGQFMASEGCASAGTYTNTWTVKDDCGNTSDTFTQVITIEDTTAPTWTTTATTLNMTLQCSDMAGLATAQALFPVASDLCDADVSNIVKTSGQFMASEGCANAGTYTNTWTVKDDCGNTSDTFTQVITIEDTTAPTWTTEMASLNVTLQCSDMAGLVAAQALFPVASDLCDADVSNVVKTSGQFMASEGCANAGTYTNTWTVNDDCGNTSDTFTQVITLEDTTIPMFTGNLPADIAVSCDAVPEPAIIQASDNCNSNLPIIFSEIKSDIQNECATNYTLTRKWTITDCSGNSASYSQIVTVRDTTAPTGTAPSNIANLQSIADIPVGSPADIKDASDNCSENVNIKINESNNGGSGCDGNAYVLTRTYTLTDCAGNKTELVQTFTVENKVSVTAIASNVTCFEANNGSILVTNSPGSIVTITNGSNEVVGNTNLPAGTYTITAVSYVNNNNQGCSAITTVTITQPPYGVTNVTGEACTYDSTPVNLLSLLPDNTPPTGIWIDTDGTNALQENILNAFGLALGSYTFEYQITDENCKRSIFINLTVNYDCRVLACENVIIHNAFSPNGDGINDVFKIDNIDQTICYPENTVEIYNRWGIMVFETVNYNNTTNAFDGTSKGRTTIKQSDGLPTGTYFYIINYTFLDGNDVIQSNKKAGYLYLSK